MEKLGEIVQPPSFLVAKAKAEYNELQTPCFPIKVITPDVQRQEEKKLGNWTQENMRADVTNWI